MSYHIPTEKRNIIEEVMFSDFGNAPEEIFLRQELARYVEQYMKSSEEEIAAFASYQRAIYLDGAIPIHGRPIASINPRYMGNLSRILFSCRDLAGVYTRGSIKENGYRMQPHIGTSSRGGSLGERSDGASSGSLSESLGESLGESLVCAFTRQCSLFDLRMLPDVSPSLQQLPVGFWDGELVNKHYPHLAGFHRVEKRFPNNAEFWPKRGEVKLRDEILAKYLSNEWIFKDGKVIEEFELSFVVHGAFAVADPDTWSESREVQKQHLISLCRLPLDYRKVDEVLDKLEVYFKKKLEKKPEGMAVNARVVERRVLKSHSDLEKYRDQAFEKKLEGVCVAQTAFGKDHTPVYVLADKDEDGEKSMRIGKSVKIKLFEFVDQVLLGVYQKDKQKGIAPENLEAGLFGLYDHQFNCYLPSCKINLDQDGVQVKDEDQRERLVQFDRELSDLLHSRTDAEVSRGDGQVDSQHVQNGLISLSLISLKDLFLLEGKIKLERYVKDSALALKVGEVMEAMPRGENVASMYDYYAVNRQSFGGMKSPPKGGKTERLAYDYRELFEAIWQLRAANPRAFRDFKMYFSRSSKIASKSSQLKKPDILVSTADPVIVETAVFDLKYGYTQYPAGFHSWFGDSFVFNSTFVERLRFDKGSTTDYKTLRELARRNSPKRKKK